MINQLARQQLEGEFVGVIGWVGPSTTARSSGSTVVDAGSVPGVAEKRQSFAAAESVTQSFDFVPDRASVASDPSIEELDRTLSGTIDWLE